MNKKHLLLIACSWMAFGCSASDFTSEEFFVSTDIIEDSGDIGQAENEDTTPPVIVDDTTPAVEDPVVEAPVFEDPVIEDPVVEDPVIQDPVIQDPVIQDPVIQDPVIQDPVVQDPVVQDPVVEDPVVEDPPSGDELLGSWIDTQANNSLSQDDLLFETAIAENRLSIATTSTETNIHSHFNAVDANNWGGYQFRGQMRVEDPSGGVGVTFLSNFPNSDHYYRLRRYSGTRFHISPHGTQITSGNTESAVQVQAGTWYNYCVDLSDNGSATRIRAKIWQDGASEPGSWQIDCEDNSATRLTSGTVGCWSMGPGSKYWSSMDIDGTSLPLSSPFMLSAEVGDTTLEVGQTTDLKVFATDENGPTDVTAEVEFTVSEAGIVSLTGNTPVVVEGLRGGYVEVNASYQGYPLSTLAFSIRPEGGDLGTEGMLTSVSHYGITWYFDRAYEVGRFVTGDYWVVGPVNVTYMTPTPSGGKHGSMLNPRTGTASGYDSRIPYYDSSLSTRFPLQMRPGDSLVSTKGHTTTGSHKDLIGRNVSSSHGHLQSAAVLTCVDAPVPSSFFRPPYVGSQRPMFDSNAMRRHLIPSLPIASGSFSAVISDANPVRGFARFFERPWILNVRDWVGRQAHPTENMPNYHREVYNVIADASLLLMSDLPDKEDLLIGFVQLGIDMHYASVLGGADSSLHRWPILFAGLMLNHGGMIDNRYSFRTKWMTYYAGSGSTSLSSGSVPRGQGWTGARVLWRQDPGAAEHEHLHPTEWDRVTIAGGGKKREAYRRSNSFTWPGVALAARIMNAEDAWGDDAFFDYLDRWMSENDAPNRSYIEQLYNTNLIYTGGACGSNFVKNMWNMHAGSFQ